MVLNATSEKLYQITFVLNEEEIKKLQEQLNYLYKLVLDSGQNPGAYDYVWEVKSNFIPEEE